MIRFNPDFRPPYIGLWVECPVCGTPCLVAPTMMDWLDGEPFGVVYVLEAHVRPGRLRYGYNPARPWANLIPDWDGYCREGARIPATVAVAARGAVVWDREGREWPALIDDDAEQESHRVA